MKVLHGMSEVAGQGIGSVKGLRANGISADMAVWRRNKMMDPPDFDLNIGYNKVKYPLYFARMNNFARKAQNEYNILHSHFGYSLLPFNLDLRTDKKRGMKIFAEFHGSELRNMLVNIDYKYFEERPSKKEQKRHGKMLRKLIPESDGVILHDTELLSHLPKDCVPVYIVPLRVAVSDMEPYFPNPDKEKPVIVHAPSRRSSKGTDRILRELKKVKGKYELMLVENMPHDQAMEIYRQADIIIDQISVGTYGVFAIEAMAMGKPVITYISEELRRDFPENLPIVSAEFYDIADKIEMLLDNGSQRRNLGIQGREYALRYHDAVCVTKHLVDIYRGKIASNNIFELL